MCAWFIAFRGSSSGQQKLSVTFTVTLMGLFYIYSLLCLSAPVRADCAQDTITLLWKMSVSNPLCFRGLHVTSASLFRSFSPLLWFFFHFFCRDMCSMETFTLNDAWHVSWTYIFQHFFLPFSIEQTFKTSLQVTAIGKSYLRVVTLL